MRRCCCCCFMCGKVTADVSQSEMESKQNRRTGLTSQNKMFTFTFDIWSKQCWKFDGSTHARTHSTACRYGKQRPCTMDDFPFAAQTMSKRMHSTHFVVYARVIIAKRSGRKAHKAKKGKKTKEKPFWPIFLRSNYFTFLLSSVFVCMVLWRVFFRLHSSIWFNLRKNANKYWKQWKNITNSIHFDNFLISFAAAAAVAVVAFPFERLSQFASTKSINEWNVAIYMFHMRMCYVVCSLSFHVEQSKWVIFSLSLSLPLTRRLWHAFLLKMMCRNKFKPCSRIEIRSGCFCQNFFSSFCSIDIFVESGSCGPVFATYEIMFGCMCSM